MGNRADISGSHPTDQARSGLGASRVDPGRDERGIDLAIVAFFAARMCGGTSEEATRDAKAMLTMFGFQPEAPNGN